MPEKKKKKEKPKQSPLLTDLRGGATHQFAKLESGLNASRVSCMGGIAPGPNPVNAVAYLMQTLEPSEEASHRPCVQSLLMMYLLQNNASLLSLWLTMNRRRQERMHRLLCICQNI